MGTEVLLCGAWVEVEGPGRRRVRRAARDFGKLGEKTRSVSKARGGERLKTTCFWGGARAVWEAADSEGQGRDWILEV